MTGVGERFKKARVAANMSQEEVGHRACVRRATISDLERGFTKNLRPETLNVLCKIIGADPDHIANGWRCNEGLGIPDISHMSQMDRIEYKLDLLLARTKHLEN